MMISNKAELDKCREAAVEELRLTDAGSLSVPVQVYCHRFRENLSEDDGNRGEHPQCHH